MAISFVTIATTKQCYSRENRITEVVYARYNSINNDSFGKTNDLLLIKIKDVEAGMKIIPDPEELS